MKRTTAGYLAMATILAVMLTGCSPTETTKKKEPVGPSAVTAPADYVHASFQAGEKAKSTIGLISLNKAISMYQMQNGSYPASLKQLQDEGMIPEIPPAPNGQKYQYDPKTGQVTVVAK